MEVFKFSRAKAEEVEVRRMYQISQPTPAVDEPQEIIDFYCDFQLPTTASHYQHARAFEVFLIVMLEVRQPLPAEQSNSPTPLSVCLLSSGCSSISIWCLGIPPGNQQEPSRR